MICTSFIVNTANADSVSFDSSVYDGNFGEQISVTVNYDFTDISVLGGGFELYYDNTALEFVSYTRTDFDASELHPMNFASPIGELTAPGVYSGAGIGTEFFLGIDDAGPVGVFVFNIIISDIVSETPCGHILCLEPHLPSQPFITLSGNDITLETFANGISSANVLLNNPDSDWDGISNSIDNCSYAVNPDQYDSNGDGIGNACDPDWNNDCIVNFADYAMLPAAFLARDGDVNFDPDIDIDGHGVIAFLDVAFFTLYFLGPPGPSHIECVAAP